MNQGGILDFQKEVVGDLSEISRGEGGGNCEWSDGNIMTLP